MEVKGVSVKTIPEFIRKFYPTRYQEWLNALPQESKQIFSDVIISSNWYPLTEALTIPIKTVGQVFFNGDWKQAVLSMGRYSADSVLKGIYKLYVKLGSPQHLIDRASRVFAAYFQPSDIQVVKAKQNFLCVHITFFPDADEAVEYNIAGWMERALEISGCKNPKVEISKSLARKDDVTEYNITWQ